MTQGVRSDASRVLESQDIPSVPTRKAPWDVDHRTYALWMRRRLLAILVIVAVIGPTACSRPDGSPTTTVADATGAGVGGVSMTEALQSIAPALASVETPLAMGSGLLLPGSVVVTTAHVVWPHRTVDVRFANGSTGSDLPVIAVDWAADLALVDVSALDNLPSPARIESGDIAPGEPVFLIGFPSGGDDAPTVVAGTLIGTRSWLEGGVDYLESDALIRGGHSGGALVSGSGAVIGMTSIEIDETTALAVDGRDVAERVELLLEGRDADGVGDRWLEDLTPSDREPETAAHLLDEASWVFDAESGVDIALVTDADGALSGSIVGPDGFLEATLVDGAMGFEPSVSGPHFASVVPGRAEGAVVGLTGNVELKRLVDPDHGRPIGVGEKVMGNIDYPGDLDWYSVELGAGQSIVVTATSPNADMALFVGPVESLQGPEGRGSSDGAGGVLDSDARLAYTAAEAGVHVVAVYDETQLGPGAYAVTISG